MDLSSLLDGIVEEDANSDLSLDLNIGLMREVEGINELNVEKLSVDTSKWQLNDGLKDLTI